MKTKLFFAALFAALVLTSMQVEAQEDFFITFEEENEVAVDLLQTLDDNFILLSTNSDPNSTHIRKLSQQGELIWERDFSNDIDCSYRIINGNENSYYLLGCLGDSATILKLSNEGSISLQKTFYQNFTGHFKDAILANNQIYCLLSEQPTQVPPRTSICVYTSDLDFVENKIIKSDYSSEGIASIDQETILVYGCNFPASGPDSQMHTIALNDLSIITTTNFPPFEDNNHNLIKNCIPKSDGSILMLFNLYTSVLKPLSITALYDDEFIWENQIETTTYPNLRLNDFDTLQGGVVNVGYAIDQNNTQSFVIQTIDQFGTTKEIITNYENAFFEGVNVINYDNQTVYISGNYQSSENEDKHLFFKATSASIILTNHEINTYQKNVTIYPNPANSSLNIDADYPIHSVHLYSMMGQKVADYNGKKQKTAKIETKSISEGNYIIVIDGIENFKTNRIITITH